MVLLTYQLLTGSSCYCGFSGFCLKGYTPSKAFGGKCPKQCQLFERKSDSAVCLFVLILNLIWGYVSVLFCYLIGVHYVIYCGAALSGTGKGGNSIWGKKFEDEFSEYLKVFLCFQYAVMFSYEFSLQVEERSALCCTVLNTSFVIMKQSIISQ